MTDLTAGKKFCRISGTWLDPETYNARRAVWDEAAFQRKGNQGELACPMIISDNQPGLQSMADGKIYDSKSEMRKGYKAAGVEEVGNDVRTKREGPTRHEKEKADKARKGSIARALSQQGFGV